MAVVRIRAAHPDDGPALRDIEWRAGEQFRTVGLDHIADDEPPSTDVLAEFARAGRSWVAVGDADRPLGYVIVDVVDGHAHIEQISVDPDHQGLGVGRALVERVSAWAGEHHCRAITLTTFADVPWNGPLYAHLGFTEMPDEHIGPELRAVVADESAHGVDAVMRRTCMELRLELSG